MTDVEGKRLSVGGGTNVATGSALVSQSIYYAKNISAAAAATNAVTVTFNSAASYPDIRILEYSGIDPVNPVDVVVGAIGNSAMSSSGVLTTTNANDLLVGANTVQTLTIGAGSGLTLRLLTIPDGDIAEDAACDDGRYLQCKCTTHLCRWVGNANGRFPRGWFSYADAYPSPNSSEARLYPRQLCGAADTADDCNGAVYSSADRWEPERCDRGMERLYLTCHFLDRFHGKRLSS